MSVITLTDRISVSVRAKNNTEKSAQNKATGANIQKALGGSGLNDTDLEEIGNVNSITDENGNEWIKMEDIIAAGRKMKENGAFADKHNGLTIDGVNYSYENVRPFGTPVNLNIKMTDRFYTFKDGSRYDAQCILKSITVESSNPAYSFWGLNDSGTSIRVKTFSLANRSEDLGGPRNHATYTIKIIYEYKYERDSIYEHEINEESTSMTGGTSAWFTGRHDSIAKAYKVDSTSEGNRDIPYVYDTSTMTYSKITAIPNNGSSDTYQLSILGYICGPVSDSSLIDWDAPNAEVERQIKNLHDTWDVSDHAGAGTGNGTYVLAGPIEFNDGD